MAEFSGSLPSSPEPPLSPNARRLPKKLIGSIDGNDDQRRESSPNPEPTHEQA